MVLNRPLRHHRHASEPEPLDEGRAAVDRRLGDADVEALVGQKPAHDVRRAGDETDEHAGPFLQEIGDDRREQRDRRARVARHDQTSGRGTPDLLHRMRQAAQSRQAAISLEAYGRRLLSALEHLQAPTVASSHPERA